MSGQADIHEAGAFPTDLPLFFTAAATTSTNKEIVSTNALTNIRRNN